MGEMGGRSVEITYLHTRREGLDHVEARTPREPQRHLYDDVRVAVVKVEGLQLRQLQLRRVEEMREGERWAWYGDVWQSVRDVGRCVGICARCGEMCGNLCEMWGDAWRYGEMCHLEVLVGDTKVDEGVESVGIAKDDDGEDDGEAHRVVDHLDRDGDEQRAEEAEEGERRAWRDGGVGRCGEMSHLIDGDEQRAEEAEEGERRAWRDGGVGRCGEMSHLIDGDEQRAEDAEEGD